MTLEYDKTFRSLAVEYLKKVHGENNFEGKTIEYPMQYLRIKLKDGASQSQRDIVANIIRTYFTDDLMFLVDTISVEQTAANTL
jgi:ABC-type antimicrobial peptide transport system permease subunit